MKKIFLTLPFFIFAFLPALISNIQLNNFHEGIKQEIAPDKETIWVDSVLKSLSIDEKIGQLIMIRALSNKDTA